MANPSNQIVARFRIHTKQDKAASLKAGRPMFKDTEVVEIRYAGERGKVSVFPAHENDPNATREAAKAGGEALTYAQVYAAQYRQFKDQVEQTAPGTPLEEAPFLTQARRSELKALNVRTVEALSALDGKNLKALGMDGRELKNQATAYLAKANDTADVTALAATVAAQQRQIADMQALLEEANGRAPAMPAVVEDEEISEEAPEGEDKALEDCTVEELKEYIRSKGGRVPSGNASKETIYNAALELATMPGDGE
ncbi:MAG: hypothetical protein JWR61_5869 [Ferruginibacter sp.]|uniref:hypothetical protein n=1 Tax=Ferruginibacter sp. TaxID=1940288 RepID=UPI00265B48AE|nr:hypothetical protein [Ferruginibacter sp.]MDB5280914.1 hypothetical protein [Ferruginibacter sp.]